MGDFNSRRGRVQGMETEKGRSVVTAQVPLAEMQRYTTELALDDWWPRHCSAWSLIATKQFPPTSLMASSLLPRRKKKRNNSPLLNPNDKYNKAGRDCPSSFFSFNFNQQVTLCSQQNEAFLAKFWDNMLSRDPKKITGSISNLLTSTTVRSYSTISTGC